MLQKAGNQGRGLTMSDNHSTAGRRSGAYLQARRTRHERAHEFVAGATTFLTMAYILFVIRRFSAMRNGQGRRVRRDLHRVRGIDAGDGILCDYPIALAPGRG